MARFRLVTLNLSVDLTYWSQRKELLREGLAELKADVIALQEVKLPENPAQWLADALAETGLIYQVHLCPKSGEKSRQEAIAILSRLPVERHAMLDLRTQNRVAQSVRVGLAEGKFVTIVNGHFYWQPGESPERSQQLQRLLVWLGTLPMKAPLVVCGDFNGLPETTAIQLMRRYFNSAYAKVHGREPEYTYPTPLPRSWKANAMAFYQYLRLFQRFPGTQQSQSHSWQGTLDYIFVSQMLGVKDCQVVLNRPSSENALIYPAGHFGLMADLELAAL